ncbi:MAG: hypothetical protein DMG45_19275 [Acidobacteria bacterium]|nr:MAG: hypothetical protein AUH16_12545 [Acidobacteria bacterium 13_2_20CM_57_7]PYT39584.1 MAG: hypothetical protein DMG45_19275 [Acidobacteriota bacterium]PYT44775.1 MAG: hypothetical protein DMG47_10410 [Acidobacteriota bacterium]PYT58087.1 MAG: hypothetical protein DMG46_12185 [Acidobacteriota bacterium]
MWSLLKKNDDECGKLRDLLEDSAAGLPAATRMEELSEAWPAAQRNHLATCGRCQEAAQDLLATREIFKGVGSATGMVRPWFSTRVVAAIAARERELTEAASTWLAVPKFASRLALASAALLLLTSTWLYEKPLPAPNQQAVSLAAQESLFESSPPANLDDVLVPVQENNP